EDSVTMLHSNDIKLDMGGGLAEDFMYSNNVASAQIYIRMGFLRKVYGILSAQLLVTSLVCAAFLTNAEAVKASLHGGMFGLLVFCFLATMGLVFALHWKARETPINFVLLFAFTLCESVTVGFCVVHYSVGLVLQALLLTLLVTVGLTLFTLQTKRDFSAWEAPLLVALLLLLGGCVIQMFVQSSALHLAISLGGAFLFSLFIVFDTANIMHKVSPEEYILASVDLYLDIINLFLYILRILNASKKD
ncbi:hypothetical protein BOX15_Mlig012592g1, partial [Macrostomum lignano]